MGLKRCLLACLLALSGVGTAAAMDATTQDPVNPHVTLDTGSRDNGGGNDTASSSRDCTPTGTGGDSSDGGDGAGTGGSMPPPRASHRNSLSWQSLLPGSIQ